MQLSDIASSRDGTTVEHNGHMVCCGMSGIWMELVSGWSGGDARQLRPGLGVKRIRRPLSREGKSDCEDGLRDQRAAESPPPQLKIRTGSG